MMKGELSREQAVAIVGEGAVARAEAKNCEPTNRVGYNGACQGDSLCEWSAGVACVDTSGYDCTVTAYYYTSNDEDQIMADADGDGSAINWVIAGYEIA